MQIENKFPSTNSERIELAKKCLALISNIAGRGARSQNPEHIGYALQELTQGYLNGPVIRKDCLSRLRPTRSVAFTRYIWN